MLKNYLITALRNISRHSIFSMINIAGLTLGLTACMLIGLYVWDEHQFDKFIPNGDSVYRIYSGYTNSEGTQQLAATPPAMATALQQNFPEVDITTRVLTRPTYKTLFEANKKRLYEESGCYADSTFLRVFPLKFIYGFPVVALDDVNDVVISNSMAVRFFGNQNPVGRQILKDKTPYIIKGVFEKNSAFHLQFDYLISLSAVPLPPGIMQSWDWHQFITYAKLKPNTGVKSLEARFQQYVGQKETVSANGKNGVNAKDKPFFQPLTDIHLYSSDFKLDIAQRGNILYVNALIIIAVFILSIACFNFINLATAKSLQRAKEVGVRKAVGAAKSQLIFQFIGETILLAFISAIISVIIAALLVPWMNDFTNKNISMSFFTNPVAIILFIALMVAVGILAGFYPAIVLSKFNPVKVLKGAVSGHEEPGKIPWLRHGLVIIQFALS
ncbi:MAG TPA: ABC transporter permease, partial [Puia sp.]|nr:ABC transporter permease [Puia sp.]